MIDRIRPSSTLAVERSLKKVDKALGKVQGRGDSAASPADIGVASRLDAKYRENYLQARNVQDAMSYLQTRDGYLSSVGDSLHKLRDLQMSMGSPILNDQDKELIMKEGQLYLDNINAISNSPEFNTHKVLDDISTSSLGIDGLVLGSKGALESIDSALSDLNSKRAENGASVSVLEARMDNIMLNNENIAKAYENVTDSDMIQDIIELKDSVNEAMITIKANDLVNDLKADSVLSLLDFKTPTDK